MDKQFAGKGLTAGAIEDPDVREQGVGACATTRAADPHHVLRCRLTRPLVREVCCAAALPAWP